MRRLHPIEPRSPRLLSGLFSGLLLSSAAMAAPHSPPRVEAGLQARLSTGQSEVALVVLKHPRDRSPRDLKPWMDAIAELETRTLACAGLSTRDLIQRYDALPLLHLRLDSGRLERLMRCPDVQSVGPDRVNAPSLSESIPLIDADQAAETYGFDGHNITVAVIDTGAMYSLSELGGCFGQGCKVVAGYDFADNDDDPNDCDKDYRHGSNVSSVVAGTDGVAPRANLAALKVFGGNCTTAADSDINGSLNWVVKNRKAYNIGVANLSLGFPGEGYTSNCDQDIPGSFTTGINAAFEAGVLVVVAAGNDGFADQVSYPSCLKNAMAVANSYDARLPPLTWGTGPDACTDTGIRADMIACSSNGGGLVDIAAPGAMITAAGVTIGGTSQASPHVSGTAALLLQANATVTPTELWAALQVSSHAVQDDRSSTQTGGYAYPRLDVLDALGSFSFDPDADQDGYSYETDCDNSVAAVNPGATEVCNGIDDNCNEKIDDLGDADGDGFTICDDCDDSEANVHPNNAEVADGLDNDCDGKVDDGVDSGGCSCGQADEPQFGALPIGAGALVWFGLRRRRRG